MANYEATKYNFSGSGLTGIEGVNTGIIIPWGDTTPPSGFLECDGSAVSQSTYANLFAVIGTTYGDPGGGNFNLPDLTDKVVQSRSPTTALATSVGNDSVAIQGTISGSAGNTTITTPTLASHTHSNAGPNAGRSPSMNENGRNSIQNAVTSSATGGGGAHSHPISGNAGAGNYSTLQPYLTLMYVIKT